MPTVEDDGRNIGAPIQLVGRCQPCAWLAVAFTTTAVAIEARRREYATTFTFWPASTDRTVADDIENLIIGVLRSIVVLAGC